MWDDDTSEQDGIQEKDKSWWSRTQDWVMLGITNLLLGNGAGFGKVLDYPLGKWF